MELKLEHDISMDMLNRSSNRTFMELKWCRNRCRNQSGQCSNRTFMELKFTFCWSNVKPL